MTETLVQGRAAAKRHDWLESTEALTAADRDGGLAADDLELLGTAAWWAGRPDEATEALERAVAAYAEAGRRSDAARVAIQLSYQAFRRLAGSVAAGWLARAERLLEGEPESGNHAWLAVFRLIEALMGSRLDEGIAAGDRAIEIARRHDADDAMFMAMSFRGMARVMAGDWQAGIAEIDEAAAAAASGQLDPRTASDIYCNTISACRSLGDLRRAGEWAAEGERWMRRQSLGGYPGICRVHRAELKMLRGEWSDAELEARQACEELERYRLMDGVGYAYYQVGEVRLRMGDLDGATEAFDRAYEYGHDAQPGFALLQLARGEAAEAARSIGRALAAAEDTGALADRARRAQLLPAQVDIALATGDLETARRAVEELETIAAAFEQPLFQAGALTARGELLLGEEKASEASPILGRSWRLWQTTYLPYESARTRLRYAEALAAEGDRATARRDLLAARSAFERLGATRDIQRVDALLDEDSRASGRRAERATKTFMFTDIVTSTDLVGLIGDDAWAELLAWHDRELRSAFAQHAGDEVNRTGDGFFVAFERAADGLACAMDIQRRLARHRHEHGFAPSVRIGLHAAEAMRQGRDFSGHGVHVAARVGAAAQRDEILVTGAVIAERGMTGIVLSEPRTVTLKGVRDPVEVRAVEWRQADAG